MTKGILPIGNARNIPLGKIRKGRFPTHTHTRAYAHAPWGSEGTFDFKNHYLWGIRVFLPIRRIGGRNTYIPQSWVRRYRRLTYAHTRTKGGGL